MYFERSCSGVVQYKKYIYNIGEILNMVYRIVGYSKINDYRNYYFYIVGHGIKNDITYVLIT